MNKDDLKKEIINEVENDSRCQKDYVEYQELNDKCFMTELNSIVLKKFYHETVPLHVVHKKEQPRIQYFEKNQKGSDYVVGDIHCQFNQLERQLLEIGFDKSKDRLFAVGDLIDRSKGEDGYRVLDYLSQDWFHSTLGNHEDLILSLLSLPKKMTGICYKQAMENGAQWLVAENPELKKLLEDYSIDDKFGVKRNLTFETLMSQYPLLHKIYFQFSKLPYLIKVGNTALIHAEVPLFITDFSDLEAKIENMHIETLESLLWGRMRIETDINKYVKGIKTIYCGHSILPEPDFYGNHRCCDLGAYQSKNGKLCIEKINCEEDKEQTIHFKVGEVEPRFDADSGYTYIRILDLPKEDQELFKNFLYGGSMPLVKKEERWGAAWVHDYKMYIEVKRSYINKYNSLEEFKKSIDINRS